MSDGYRTLHLDDVPTVRFADEDQPNWKPVRRHLGVQAFGTNAFVADAGEIVIERHDELVEHDDGVEDAVGHQELYLVLGGRARFTVAGRTFDVPERGMVFIEDPALVREAVAQENGTVVFAVGAPLGAAFSASEWEERFFAQGTEDAG